VLAEDRECVQKTGRNLREYYTSQGMKVIHLPIPDFGVPTREALEQAVEAVHQDGLAGRHIAIHCHAGIGRTGMFAACLAKRIFGVSGEEAIQWVRKYVFEAVEAVEQRQLVLEF
jgi:protein-tyrosine phosphatase